MTQVEIRLNATQADIIEHRLGVPDAMAQVFGPSGDDIWNLPSDEAAQQKLEHLLGILVTQTDHGMLIRFETTDEDHVAVLTELVAGNTMGAVVADMLNLHPDEPQYKEGVWLRKVLRQVETKWENAGLDARFNE